MLGGSLGGRAVWRKMDKFIRMAESVWCPPETITILLISYILIQNSEIAQSCPTLYDPMDCSPPGSSVHGILQARILEWVPFPSPGDLPDLGIEPTSPALRADALTYKV